MKNHQQLIQRFRDRFAIAFNKGVVADKITQENIEAHLIEEVERAEMKVFETLRSQIQGDHTLTYDDVKQIFNKVENSLKQK